jgi:hypothetical protein
MPITNTPNGGLIEETNQQYYAGSQTIISAANQSVFNYTFDTELDFRNSDPGSTGYALNNFKLYASSTGAPDSFEEFTPNNPLFIPYTVSNNTITVLGSDGTTLNAGTYLVVQLKSRRGGSFGDKDAYGSTVEENYGSYEYIKIVDIVNNFLLAYVGEGKLISNVKRTDVIFHAKRAIQEFSFDTLKVVKSQELTVPIGLSMPLPQDYINLVAVSRIDKEGVKHPIYPTDLSIRPQQTLIQDNDGMPVQDNQGTNTQGNPSKTNERWDNNQIKSREELYDYWVGLGYQNGDWPQGWGYPGQQYGLDTTLANFNGYYMIDQAFGKISFSNDLTDSLIVLEYISDGLAYEEDMKIPKMAEEAMYAHILHAIIASKIGQPEYIVRRLKKERSSKLRNAKLRLSNIKPIDIIQAFRGKSKWIKH